MCPAFWVAAAWPQAPDAISGSGPHHDTGPMTRCERHGFSRSLCVDRLHHDKRSLPGDMLRRGLDIRYVVTSLRTGNAEHIYATIYCVRGQAENLIKQRKTQTASDRTSCRSPIRCASFCIPRVLVAARCPRLCALVASSAVERVRQHSLRLLKI
jgi:hypothetical protein